MEAKSIDDILVKSMNEQSTGQVEVSHLDNVEPSVEAKVDEQPKVEELGKTEQVDEVQPTANSEKVEAAAKESTEDKPIDEYGNQVEKPKVYTEEEVQRMIRDRLSRGRHQEQPIQQPAAQPQQTQEQEENWETQLEAFVDKTIEKRQRQSQEQQWQHQQEELQAEFESKFSSGMGKYSDFQQVVAGKPITNDMMLATRSLENPAAFIYGAAKFHAQELSRIAKIPDSLAQAAEIGRLHEKMIKSKNVMSNAPKPLEVISSDMPGKKVNDYPSIDERIDDYAKKKRR